MKVSIFVHGYLLKEVDIDLEKINPKAKEILLSDDPIFHMVADLQNGEMLQSGHAPAVRVRMEAKCPTSEI